VRFFSPGEPTQRMDVIKECVQYARFISPQINFELQTNGLFSSSEDVAWIADNFNAVWFSLDGPSEINDNNRPDSHGHGRTGEIEDNLQAVATKTFVGVRSTVVEKTIENQVALVEYYHKLGVKYLALNPEISPIQRNSNGNEKVTKNSIMRFAEGFIPAYKRSLELGMILLNANTFNFDEKTDVACRSCLPMPQLNPDGSISSCDMALYMDTKAELQVFIYGHWEENDQKIIYYLDKIEHLRGRRLHNMPICKTCEIAEYCAGGCAGRVAFQTGDIYCVIPEYCAATKFMAKHMEIGKKENFWSHP